jgi:predicted kinase
VAERLLVLVAGYAGSGKTETGKLLAQATGWALVDKDTITRPMTERLLEQLHGDPHDRQTQLYLTHVRPLEYECLMRTGWENIECGTSTILAAPFLHEVRDADWVAAVQRRCTYLGAALRTIWVDSDAESMRERLIARNAERDAWKLSNWQEYLAGIDLALRPCVDHLVIDNRVDTGEPLLHQVLRLAQTLTSETVPLT